MTRFRSVLVCGLLFHGVWLLAQNAAASPSNPQLASAEIERKVNDLLARMTLEEKIGQLVQYSATEAHPDKSAGPTTAALNVNPPGPGGVDSYELAKKGELGSMLNTVGQGLTNHFQHAAVDNTRLHIPLLFGADVIHGFRTIFPVPLGTASSWDPELVTDLAHMAAEEARTAGVDWVYSPMVDIARDARWGRVTEGAGEDPYLGSAIARAYIRGYQGNSLSEPTSVAASVKHFAAYGAAEAGREYNTTDMSDLLLRQVYLQPYHAAVEAGSATIMSAFNSLNGVPASANPYLMQTILRDEWGFDGLVVSDYTAVMELTHHGIALNAASATDKALTAGVDIDMNSHFYDVELPALVKSGKVPMPVVDEAVRRVLRVKFALGLFDHPFTEGPEVTKAVPEHRALARRAAEESFVLLQNNAVNGQSLLPLAAKAQKIALIGPLADDSRDMVGAWSGANNFDDVRTLRQTLSERAQQHGASLIYEKGTDISGTSTAGFAEAVNAARNADLVVMALGESSDMSGEAASRAYLDLPGNQQQLLEAVQAAGKPVVLLVFSGRPLVLDWAAAHVPAIMEVWFPGVETGPAIADVLYGDTMPSGKLTMSFPRAVGQEPLYYNQLPTGRPIQHPDPAHPNAYVETKYVSKYLDVPNDALFPFGHGLTYTTFRYANVSISKSTLSAGELTAAPKEKPLSATAEVTNTGSREGTEIVQCYVNVRGASTEQPVRNLKGFARITLKPGESRTVSFPLGYQELSFYNVKSKQVVEPDTEYTVYIGGSSTAEQAAHFRIEP
ncbi:glycoside hydrolase family 3 N-terminal domain-containing protein [Silvibacterium acidisoli]|uniref:glycoside hydrolase family 3 N-terminal domain-containing protein n=1 Tax=Acidobacteriaceae bacterium ZG23-2 TaxID=2883246 RepID=UPI00406BE25B